MLDLPPLVTIIKIRIKKVCKHEHILVITPIGAAPVSGLAPSLNVMHCGKTSSSTK